MRLSEAYCDCWKGYWKVRQRKTLREDSSQLSSRYGRISAEALIHSVEVRFRLPVLAGKALDDVDYNSTLPTKGSNFHLLTKSAGQLTTLPLILCVSVYKTHWIKCLKLYRYLCSHCIYSFLYAAWTIERGKLCFCVLYIKMTRGWGRVCLW